MDVCMLEAIENRSIDTFMFITKEINNKIMFYIWPIYDVVYNTRVHKMFQYILYSLDSTPAYIR